VRIAIVDVGTNTTRLFVADVSGRRLTAELHRESRVTRLGSGVDTSGNLADEAIEREHGVLADYAAKLGELGAERTVAVMTSAVRDAGNGRAFAQEVAGRYGFDVRVLSGDEEAALTYRGATDELPPGGEEELLVLDIGGGSTELVIGSGPTPDFHVSTQAGVVRQADRHIAGDAPSDAELQAFAADVRQVLGAAVPPPRRHGVQRAIAVAGTPTSLAAIAQSLDPYDPARVHGYRLTARELEAILARLRQMPLEERRRVPGLHPDRAITIIPGIVILAEVMALFELAAVTVSEHDILRGAALSYAGR
jgi:exopolyphosphatase/guanosine-5'-triphosphate,3'-diphosphate pyrophosphatase